MSQGTLEGIARHQVKKGPLEELDEVDITVDHGVSGDARGDVPDRNVTVLSLEAWQAACDALGQTPSWITRRANLLVSGLDLKDSAGKRLTIGDVVLEVTKETKPCGRMDEAVPGLLKALVPDWRGGACCRVIQGGSVSRGLPVHFE